MLRLAYLGVTSAFAVLRTLPMSDRERTFKSWRLRYPIAVLQRQLGKQKVRLDASDRALLAALLHRLPSNVTGRLRLLARPDTVLRLHRNLTRTSPRSHLKTRRPGQLSLSGPSGRWYCIWPAKIPAARRVHGELLVLGVKVAASTV